ncbi:MAG: oligosaccharide flippase family protein, partial [Actinomycetia bacterium]|nr:oligosaccharide flippase family protein [Actinomycetes bacterium]
TTVIVASALGTSDFGLYAGTLSLMMLVAPFTALGYGQLLVREAANADRSIRQAVEAGLSQFLLGNALGLPVVIGLGTLLFGSTPRGVIIALALSELLFGRLIIATRQVGRSIGRGAVSALPHLASRSLRLGGAAIMVGLDQATVTNWALLHALADLGALLIGLRALAYVDAFPHHLARPSLVRIRAGLVYALNGSAAGLKNDADKAMLLSFGLPEAAGAYAIAYRGINAAQQPLIALLNASTSSFFSTARTRPESMLRLAVKYSRVALAYGATATVGLWLTAPWLAAVLGDEYGEVTSIVRWLSPLPMLISLHLFASRSLTATDR